MYSSETVTLSRSVIGTLIPAGTPVELPEGAAATITQSLGGSFTIVTDGHMFRIEGKDADALGKEITAGPDVASDASDAELEKAAWDQLHTCYDPEIPVDIVELGLVYECKLEPLDGENKGKRKAVVRMTLTAPGCGMGEVLVGDVRSKLLQVPTVTEADVQMVFDPPWTRDMMSEAAKLQTGMF